MESRDLSYTAVVDYNNINLTPLGKFLMPPPMFEKQFKSDSARPPSCLNMYGHWILSLYNTELILKNCIDTHLEKKFDIS